MTNRFGRETWSLIVPDSWRAWNDDECTTLVGPDEIGALQISAAFKNCEVLESDLKDFASDHLDSGAKARLVTAGDFAGFEIAFSDGDIFWRHWYLRNGRQMLFITYNCLLEFKGVEDDPIYKALNSLQQKMPDEA